MTRAVWAAELVVPQQEMSKEHAWRGKMPKFRWANLKLVGWLLTQSQLSILGMYYFIIALCCFQQRFAGPLFRSADHQHNTQRNKAPDGNSHEQSAILVSDVRFWQGTEFDAKTLRLPKFREHRVASERHYLEGLCAGKVCVVSLTSCENVIVVADLSASVWLLLLLNPWLCCYVTTSSCCRDCLWLLLLLRLLRSLLLLPLCWEPMLLPLYWEVMLLPLLPIEVSLSCVEAASPFW